MEPNGWSLTDAARLTQRARAVLALAQDEARRLNHSNVGPEHLLLGLAREGDGVAAKVLAHAGVSLDATRHAVESILGRGVRVLTAEPQPSVQTRQAIVRAADEAERLGHRYIGTEHLLLALARERDGIAAGALGVLGVLGVDLAGLRTRTVQMLAGASSGPGAGAPVTWIRQAAGGRYPVTVRLDTDDPELVEALNTLLAARAHASWEEAALWLARAGMQAQGALIARARADIERLRQAHGEGGEGP